MEGTKYTHKEAFCIMIYECKSCGKREKIYNTRDGVTPFTTKCVVPGCNGYLSHTSWHLDDCNPDFKPPKGMRVFIDLTKDKYKEYKQKYIDEWWDKESPSVNIPSMKDHFGTKEKALEILTEDWKEGQPDIKVIDG